jgi:mannosylglycerate hydrolase
MTTIHLVSHTHWDREWYLTFQQFRLKLVYLIDHLLNILAHDPNYKYYLLDGQTILLEDYLEIRPERQAELIKQINNGRILIGPWYVSPDEYLVSPESHIRNLLEGNKLCQFFGAKMAVGYLPDDFGHIGQMPQILRGFGIESACLWRGLDDQPCELEWKAPDGSSVLLSYLRDSYSNAASITTSVPEKFSNDVNTLCLSLLPYSMTGEILLMQGTDHMEPLDGLAQAIGYYQHQKKQYNLVHSNLPQYFNSVRSRLEETNKYLPVISGELRSSKHSALLQNVLSTRIWLKQRNHNCETELLKWVEPLDAWNKLLETSTNALSSGNDVSDTALLNDHKSIIRHAWKLLMQCHPHDSICGTSIDQVANEMRTRFDQVDQISQELINQSLENICDLIDTQLENDTTLSSVEQNILSAIVIFNPNDISQSGLVNLSLKLAAHYSAYEIIDTTGCTLPSDFSGMGSRELISAVMDKKALKQAFGMIHEGHIAGMVVRDFEIERHQKTVIIRAILSDHGNVNINRWREGIAQMDAIMVDQLVTEFQIHAYSDPEIQISFVAKDIPQHGFNCYWIKGCMEPGHEAAKPVKLSPIVQAFFPVMARAAQIPLFSRIIGSKKRHVSQQPKKIENEFFVVEANSNDGTLTITDKRNHQVYSGMNRLIDSGDRGDLYNFCPPEHDLNISPKVIKLEYERQNTHKKLICYYQLKLPARLSDDRSSRGHQEVTCSIISTATLVNGISSVDIHTEVDNTAHDHRLRVHFPAPFSSSEAWYDGHFEIVRRPIGIPEYDETWEEPPRPEVPQRLFTSVANERISLTIANFGLPEVEVFKNQFGNSEIAITLLRCVDWLSRDDLATRKSHAGPMEVAVPDAQMEGKISFDYSIIPGGAHWRDSIPRVMSFISPLKSMTSSVHAGVLLSKDSFVENFSQDFMLTTIKTAENGDGLIIRGYNLTSKPINVSLKLMIPIKQAQLVSLDESKIESIPITQGSLIDLNVGSNKIVTLRLNL